MTRRIICYVVFVTLIWGVSNAHTDDEGKLRDMFKSNMTRTDFSNLLQSLIKLNEQRVSVLQKLYRLEDYGVLSEVLRSGDKKTGNGNPSNLFLIVMSKNQNDPSRRKIAFQPVESVSSLNVGSNNNHSKLDFVLDPANYFTQNKENRLLDSIFGNLPRVGPLKKHRADDGSKKISTTKETLKFNKPGLRTEVKHNSNILRAATSLKEIEESKYRKENSRHEIVNNKGRRPNTNEKLLGYDGNRKHPQTVGYNSQSNEYVEKDFTIENEKLTTKPNITKHIRTSNHQNSKYPSKGKDEDHYESPLSHVKNDQNRHKIISDISIKKYHGIYHYNSKTNKYTPKVKVSSNQQNGKLTTKPITIKDIITSNHKYTKYPLEGKDELEEDDYGSPTSNIENAHYGQYTNKNSDISIKKHHDNNHKTNKYTPKVKVQSKQQNDKLTTKSITIKYIATSNLQNPWYPLEDIDEDDYGSPFSNIENDHYTQIANINSDIPKLHVNNHEGKDELEEDDYGSPSSNIKNDHYSHNRTTKTNKNSDISIKKIHVNNHNNPKAIKNTPKVPNIQRNQHPKLNQNKSNLNNQGNKYSKIKAVKTTTPKKDYRINGTVKKSSVNNQVIKNPNLNHNNTNPNNDDLTYTSIKDEYATMDTKLPSLASENSSKSVISEISKDTQNERYPDYDYRINGTVKKSSVNNQVIKNPNLNHNNTNLNNDDLTYTNIKYEYATKDTKLPSLASENVYGSKPVSSEITKDTQYERYPDYDYRIIGTVKKASKNNQVIKNPNLNHNNTNANNDDLTYTSIKDEYATMDTKLPSLASENINSSKSVISEISKNTQNERYPDFEEHKDIRDNSNKGKSKAAKDTPFENDPGVENLKVLRDNPNTDKPVTVTDTLYGHYPDFEDHKDVRDNSNKGKSTTAKGTPLANDPDFENLKVVRDKSNNDKPETTTGTPFGNNFHGFEHHNNFMKNLNRHKPNTVKELHQRDNPNVKSKIDTDYYGVKMVDTGKSGEEFSVFITNVGNGTVEEVKQQNDTMLTLNAFNNPKSKHIARKPFAKCLNKKALKLCCKSCISAYKNVCRKLKCTSRSKKALKSECKRSCKKTFASSSSKYSDESSGDENSDESDSDYS